MKYYQEIAPSVAMDRAEVISLTESLKTPAGTFGNCLKTQEGSALNPLEKELKVYAPGIGLLKDGEMLLTKYGYIDNESLSSQGLHVIAACAPSRKPRSSTTYEGEMEHGFLGLLARQANILARN